MKLKYSPLILCFVNNWFVIFLFLRVNTSKSHYIWFRTVHVNYFSIKTQFTTHNLPSFSALIDSKFLLTSLLFNFDSDRSWQEKFQFMSEQICVECREWFVYFNYDTKLFYYCLPSTIFVQKYLDSEKLQKSNV
jgi:hypothetical protein